MPTVTDAALAAIAYAALYAGHQVGDHIVQTTAAAAAKGAPTAAGLHPWTGWGACAHHVSSYALVQAIALAAACLVAPLSPPGLAAALAVSASTHAVIDRRWLVRLIVRRKRCEQWADGPYLLDQSLHHGALLVAALAATISSTGGAAAVLLLAMGLVAAAMAIELRQSISLPRG